MKGFTFKEMIEGGQSIKKKIDETGEYPEGTTKEDWMFIGDVAVYTPYIPLFQTPLPSKGQNENQ